MRRISTKRLQPGMQLAQPVISADGTILLAKGQTLRASYIDRLRQLGVSSVYVVDPRFPDIDANDFLSERARAQALRTVRDACTSLIAGSVIDMPAVTEIVDMLIDDLSSKPDLLVNVFDIRTYDDYTFAHSVNVCSFAILIGMSFSLNSGMLRELAIGALMHDLGKTCVPLDLLNKPGSLSDEEFAQVQKHTSDGFDILRKQGEIGLLSAHIALQHHERVDGTGYPRALAGSEIHLYARIVAVADVYDALVSDRPYRSRFLPHEAAARLALESETAFDAEVVRKFLRKVAFYPTGTLVRLSTGYMGVVVDINQPMTTRPIVRILYDAQGEDIGDYFELDLSKSSNISIIEVISDETRLA
ncbi:MAG: HD-GYP domain-containing protein [Firmicutes bacterium]|nr:HD-GYP domain-containing protein [Bacillota bacterium]